MAKTLVVYYSQSRGNTKKIAQEIASTLGADLAAIDTVQPYNCSYDELVYGLSKTETQNKVCPPIKPLDKELVLKAARECGKIVTCEEHSIIGGLGEAVCSLLAERLPTPVRRIGVNDEFGHSGPGAALLQEFGLYACHVEEVVKEFLNVSDR